MSGSFEDLIREWVKDPIKNAKRRKKPLHFSATTCYYGYDILGTFHNGILFMNWGDINEKSKRRRSELLHVHQGGSVGYTASYSDSTPTYESVLAQLRTPYGFDLRPCASQYIGAAKEVLELRKDPAKFLLSKIEYHWSELTRQVLSNMGGKPFFECLRDSDKTPNKDFVALVEDPLGCKVETEFGDNIKFFLGLTDRIIGRRPDKDFIKFVNNIEKYGWEVAATNIAPIHPEILPQLTNNSTEVSHG